MSKWHSDAQCLHDTLAPRELPGVHSRRLLNLSFFFLMLRRPPNSPPFPSPPLFRPARRTSRVLRRGGVEPVAAILLAPDAIERWREKEPSPPEGEGRVGGPS